MIRGFVQAIADEVTSVWNRYNVEIGPPLRLTKPHAGCRQEIQPQFLILLAFRPPRFQHLVDPCANLFCNPPASADFRSRGSLLLAIRFAGSASPRRIRIRFKDNPNEYNCFASFTSGRYGFIPRNSGPALKTLPQESLVQSLPPRFLAGSWPSYVERLDLVLAHELPQPFSGVLHTRMNMQARLAVFFGELDRLLRTAR